MDDFFQKVQNKLAKLSKVVLDIKKNNTPGVVEALKDANIDKELQNNIIKVHENIMKDLDESVIQNLDDKELYEAIGKKVSSEMNTKASKLKSTLPKDQRIFEQFDEMEMTMKLLTQRYRFYEYKYTQLNLFMLAFTDKCFKACSTYIDFVRAASSQHSQNQIDVYVKMLQNLKESNLMDEEAFKRLLKSTENMKNNMEQLKEEFEKKIREKSNLAVEELVQALQPQPNTSE